MADSYGSRVSSLRQPLPPYLQKQRPAETCPGCRPAVINITIGRQLFVDDFLVRNTSGVMRTFFPIDYDSHNPVVAPTEPWEISGFRQPYRELD